MEVDGDDDMKGREGESFQATLYAGWESHRQM